MPPAAAFTADLGFDASHRQELIQKLSEEFCVKIDPQSAENMTTIPAALAYFQAHPKAR